MPIQKYHNELNFIVFWSNVKFFIYDVTAVGKIACFEI